MTTQLAPPISHSNLATPERASTRVREPSRASGGFLRHVHYFRAFAIVSIVCAHVWDLPIGHADRPILYSVRELLFHASTIYFVFISGFLFIHLSGDFNAKRYYRSKALYVLLPYTLLSTAIYCAKRGTALGSSNTLEFLTDLGQTLLEGTAVGPYWYIPFAAITFLVSPLLLALPPRAFRWLCVIACPLPLLGTRTLSLTWWLFVYFVPVYLLGGLAATNYGAFTAWVRANRLPLMLGAVLSSVWLAALDAAPHSVGPVNVTESLFYIQKISVCFLTLEALQRWESRETRLLDSIATYSFAIYFTHPILACTEFRVRVLSLVPDVGWLVVASSIALVPAILGVNLLLCATAKRVLGRRSRYLIGV